MARRRAALMAESGIQRAAAELQSQNLGRATKSDAWSTLGNQGGTAYAVGSDSFRIQVLDAGSRVNIQTADHDTLVRLPLSADQVDALMDWREKGQTARPAGAKDDYYNSLSKPYNAKLLPFGSVDELLQVKGFTPKLLFQAGDHAALSDLVTVDSASADLNPDGKPLLDIRSATMDQLQQIGVTSQAIGGILQGQGGVSKLGDVLLLQGMDLASAKAILSNCQVGQTPLLVGLININTASADVIAAVPGIESDMASAIVDRQSNGGFLGLGELVDVPGMDLPTLAKVVDHFCTGSRAWEVRVIGTAAGIDVAMTAALTLDDKGGVTIVREQPSPFANSAKQWNWPETASEREVVGGIW